MFTKRAGRRIAANERLTGSDLGRCSTSRLVRALGTHGRKSSSAPARYNRGVFQPARHETITSDPWNDAQVREAIAGIVEDAARARGDDGLWAVHPADDPMPGPRTGIYFGAAGVCWALRHLAERGYESPAPARDTAGLMEICVASPETGEAAPSYFVGETGVRFVTGDGLDRMVGLIEGNIENPCLEFLWGSPGTMIPALVMYRRTGEERWRDLWLRNARFLLSRFEYHEDAGCRLWTQDLYGEIVRLLGAGHGFAMNAGALLAGIDLLDESESADLVESVCQTLEATAIREAGVANWPPHIGTPRRGREPMLVQWCHGAPGMITSLAALPARATDTLEALLCAGGELVWGAGPLSKGPGLCHGTAGNGYAFLALFARTGDAMWLERARRFAIHALAQSDAARARHGRGRHSLYSGDLGVACYAADCIDARAGLPLIDTFR